MDKRRRRYVMHDVYFLDDPLGCAVFDRFGAAGVALWMGFIAACKKNHIEGEMSYTTDAEALAVVGLPGLNLIDNDGQPFTLEEFWTLLGDHKVTRRRRSGRRLHVACTRWERWQVNPRSRDAGSQNGRSGDGNTDQVPPESERDTALETETERETETVSSSASAEPPEDDRIEQVWNEIARRKLALASGNVGNPKNWTARVVHEDRSLLIEDARRYVRTYPTITVSQLADVLMGNKQLLRMLPKALKEAS